MYNIRVEVREIQPLKESIEKIRAELSHLKREIKSFEEKIQYPNICVTCGKPILPEFNVCPYCGEPLKVVKELIPLEKYR
jgi:rRNA maturation endonuclease Nob1